MGLGAGGLAAPAPEPEKCWRGSAAAEWGGNGGPAAAELAGTARAKAYLGRGFVAALAEDGGGGLLGFGAPPWVKVRRRFASVRGELRTAQEDVVEGDLLVGHLLRVWRFVVLLVLALAGADGAERELDVSLAHGWWGRRVGRVSGRARSRDAASLIDWQSNSFWQSRWTETDACSSEW